jgi:hypothetical protein
MWKHDVTLGLDPAVLILAFAGAEDRLKPELHTALCAGLAPFVVQPSGCPRPKRELDQGKRI